MLDENLKMPIGPGGVVSGFTAWECPGLKCPSSDLRLVICDMLGKKDILPIAARIETDAHQFLDRAGFKNSGEADLSGAIIVPVMDTCPSE